MAKPETDTANITAAAGRVHTFGVSWPVISWLNVRNYIKKIYNADYCLLMITEYYYVCEV